MGKSICSQRDKHCLLGVDALSSHRILLAVSVLRCIIGRE